MTTTFGTYGGRYVPETLIPALDELTEAWQRLCKDEGFRAELHELLTVYAGRPTPLTRAARVSGVGRPAYTVRSSCSSALKPSSCASCCHASVSSSSAGISVSGTYRPPYVPNVVLIWPPSPIAVLCRDP